MANVVPVEDVIKVLNSNPKYDYSHFLRSKNPNLGNLLISRVLTGKGRDFVIRQIKAPLQKTLIRVVKLYIKVFGKLTKENTTKRNTHTLLDLEKEFFGHYVNETKTELMRAGWFLLEFENEHDSHYEYFIHWLLKRINEERAKGNWIDMPAKFPQQDCWKD